MKISDAFLYAKSKLKNSKIESYFIDSIILLRHITNLSKEEIIFNENLEINEENFKKFDDLITRRCKKEPISHLTNHREFFGLDFFVDKNVLDPRCDSEILVEIAIKKIQNLVADKIKMLEIGVGSGCLTISILKNCDKKIQATGFDISLEALEICKKNIVKHNLENDFLIFEADLFKFFVENKNQKFDLIISNPPYIKKSDIEKLDVGVKDFEPRIALDGGIDGLNFYKEIAKKSKEFLTKNGLVILEIGFDQKQEIIEIFESYDFILNQAQKDYGANDRVLVFGIS